MKRCEHNKHKPGCRVSRPLCTWRRKAQRCSCDGIQWPGRASKNGRSVGTTLHRRGSSAGKFGCCRHHPEYAQRMYAALEEPVRRVR